MAISSQNIENLVKKLENVSYFTLKKTLAIVAKITKRSHEADIFQKYGGLALLLSLLEKPNNSIIDMSMSAIANCSMFPECKKEVRRLDGLLVIVSVLKNLKSTSILNRTARALANLAEDEENATVIEELGAIEELSKLLDGTTDTECQQSVLRALKILCTTHARKRIVVEKGCIKTVVELLKSDRPALQSSAIKTLCELTKNCPKELALQVQDFDGIKEIIKLTSHDKHSVCSVAVTTIVHLCAHAHVRVAIGSEGGIRVLYQQAKSNDSNHIHLTLKSLEGLCFCCREAVNRNRVFECGGIELLLKHFSDSQHPSLQRKIITAFNCFYYNEKCLEFLLNGGIVSALLLYLKKVIQTCHIIDHSDDYSENYDQESFTSDFSSPSASPRNTPTTMETSNISLNETFLEEAATLAMQVRDAKESNRVLTFKRKRNTKASFSSSPSAIKTIDQSHSLFSFSSLDSTTETTSMMSTCTLSCRNTTSPFTSIHAHPRIVVCSTPAEQQNNDDHISKNILVNDQLTEQPANLDKTTIKETELSSHSQSPKATELEQGFESCTYLYNSCASNTSAVEYSPERNTILTPSMSPPKPERPVFSHNTVHGPGHNALLLLSRFSQMGDQKGLHYLITKPCMEVFLDYLSLLDNPSSKCAHILHNLTLDPQCYESLVGIGLACSIHRQLCYGWTESYCTAGSLLPTGDDKKDLEEEQANADKTAQEDSCSSQIPESSMQRCKGIGRKLIDNLACQSQTPFGKGVLMHLLSKGSGEELLGCVVTLPFVCRSKKLQQQMLVVRGGLKMLCDLLLTKQHEDKIFAMALYSASFLSLEFDVSTPISVTTHKSDSNAELKRGKRKLFAEDAVNLNAVNTETNSSKRHKSEDTITAESSSHICNNCRYHTNTFGPYDTQLEIDSGERIVVHRCVLSKASDMFAAMFSSYYKEGSMQVVKLKEITQNVLILAVHKAYGCVFTSLEESIVSRFPLECTHASDILDSMASDDKFNFLIDVLAAADKFLLQQLKHFCECVLPTYINESNLVSFCLYSAHYHSISLCTFGMKFLLTKIKDITCQYKLAKQICNSPESNMLVNSYYEVLLQHLQKSF